MHTCSVASVVCDCNSMDCSPPGSSVHGIFQARILEWVAISFSRGSSRPRNQTQVSWKSPALTGGFFTTKSPGKPPVNSRCSVNATSSFRSLGEFKFVAVQSLSRARLFSTPWTAARQASLSFTLSRSLLKLRSIESVMPSKHLL